MNTEIREVDELSKLVDNYCDEIYLNRTKLELENFQSMGINKTFDLCKYVVFYYFKKIVQTQIGKKKQNYSFDEFADEIAKINEELEFYMLKKYPAAKLIENIKSIPINSRRAEILIPKKKSLFIKFGDKEDDIYLNQVQKLLFGDEKYFERYIESNKNPYIEEFELTTKLSLYSIVDSIEDILRTLKSQINMELNQNSDIKNMKIHKIKDINFILENYIKDYFEAEFKKWILNEKLKLIDLELQKIYNLNKVELSFLIQKKETYLDIIENIMSELIFRNFEFGGKIDKLIEKNIYRIYDKIPWNLDLEESIEYIDKSLFFDLVYKTAEIVYREIEY